MKHFIIIDTGSSSMRGLLMDSEGQILETKQLTYQMDVKDSDQVEQDSGVFRDCFYQILRDLNAVCIREGITVSALSFTSQRSSVLPVDKEGIPLSPILMWYDKRSSLLCDELNETHPDTLYSISGMKASPVFSAPKMRWFRDHQPEVFARTHKLLGIHDYLLYLSTGHFVTDTSLASRTGLLDTAKGSWSPTLLAIYGISEEMLCSLIPPGSIAGYTSAELSRKTGIPKGVPVISAGGDQQCSLLGQGLFENSSVGITSGTASYVVALSEQPIFDSQKRINLNLSSLPGKWVMEASNMASGSVYNWNRSLFYPDSWSYEEINADILSSPPGAKGLIMLPDLGGKGCPQWDPYARGSYHNIGFEMGRADFSRAMLEGIAAEIGECFQVLKDLLPTVRTVSSAGGLSSFPEFNQILADMLESPILASPVRETTGLGAWSLAAVALGMYTSAGDALKTASKRQPSSRTFSPIPERSRLYRTQAEIRRYLRSSVDSKKLRKLFASEASTADLNPPVPQ